MGNPTSDQGTSVSQQWFKRTGSESMDGLDAEVVSLPSWTPGHVVTVTGASVTDYDLDVTFYDADRVNLGNGEPVDGADCVTSRPDEICEVPAGAAYAVVRLWLGRDVDWSLTVVSTPEVPVPPVLTIPTWFTWGKTSLTVVIVPASLAPLYDANFGVLPEGTGVGADSAYVSATLDATRAWETAMDAYVAQHPEAAWLEALEVDVGVLGVDRTVADMDAADVRIVFAPTGGVILGVAIATETDGDRFEQCDIVNFQWLVASFTSNDVYNVHMQEFGHCLGLDHPEEPTDDPMQGSFEGTLGDPANPRYCLTSLDIRGLEGAYAWVGEGATWRSPPAEVTLDPALYVAYPAAGQTSCPNPA